MKKFTFLFALLCASVMGWADTEKFVAANASLNQVYINPGWGGEDATSEASFEYNETTGVITGTIYNELNAQWQGQIKLNHGVAFTAGKQYVFSCDIKTSNATSNITIKVPDTDGRIYVTDFSTAADVAKNFSGQFTAQAGDAAHLVFDFGKALANTVITISNISFVEKAADPSANWWDSESYLGSALGAAYDNKYKMIAETGVGIVNIQGDPASIYVNTSTDVGLTCSLGEANYHKGGAALFLHLSAFTNQETVFTITNNNGTYTCKVYNKDGVVPVADAEKPSMADASVSVDSKTHNSVVLAISGATDNVGVTQYVVKNHSDNSAVGEYTPAEGKITVSALSPSTAYDWDVYAKDAAGNVSDNCKNITFTTDALASNYCGETLSDGNGATVDMSCEFKNNKYIITFNNPTLNSEASTLAGFNGSFCTIGGAGAHDVRDYYSVNNSERIVLEFDGVPNFYTPMYINIPANNQRTFSWPNDVIWGSCPAVAVTGVSLNHSELEMQVGGATQTLIATIAPANATNQNVTWASDHPEVASVINGVVTAEGEGTARITVTTEDGGFTDYCDVTVTIPAVSKTEYKDYATTDVKNIFILYSVTRNVDQTLTFKLDEFEYLSSLFGFIAPEVLVGNNKLGSMTLVDGKYTFTTADTYTPDDELSCKFHFVYGGGGDKYITFSYTVGSEQAAPASIPVGAVVLNKKSNTLSVGETDNLTATVYPSFASAAGTITWASDATAYATVVNGTVTAVAAGTANITATCGGVTSDPPYVVTVTASLTEAKFYGCGAFENNAGKVVAYDYVFTRATNHKVTLDVVFSRSMNGIIGSGNFMIYINGVNQHMTYTDATHTATYDFGAQAEDASINYYFYFPLDGGGLHQIPQTAYVVGSSNDAVHAFAIGENENNVDALAAADGQAFDKVFVLRSFTAGSLYTLVLPFNADASVLPGQLTKLNNTIVKENGDLKVNFVDADAIEAGVPYLYEPSANVANPVFSSVTINKNLNPTISDERAKYYGIYAPTTGVALKAIADAYVLGNDKYLYAASGLNDEQQMKALRGYFVLNFPAAAPGAPKRMAQVIFNGNETETPTDIENVQTSDDKVQKLMQNGQLFIIRDGKMYNAQGQLVK